MADDATGTPFDVVVIGAGPAGVAATLAASAAGATVLLLDHISLGVEDGVPPTGKGWVTVRGETRVWGLFPDLTVAATDARGSWTVRARAVVVATGASDRPCPIPGWHLPRTLTPAEAVAALDGGDIGPDSRVAIVAGPDLPDDLERAWALAFSRATVVARVGPVGTTIVGPDRVTAIWVDGETIPCDRVILDAGRQARDVLARMAGCALLPLPGGVLVPETDEAGQTSVPGLFVVGDAAGPSGGEITFWESHLAGLVAAGAGADATAETRATLRRLDPAAVRATMAAALPDIPLAPTTVLCRCEGILTEAVDAAIRAGAASANDVKRRTRAGMGACQGTLCVPPMADRLRALLPPDAMAPSDPVAAAMTARPPALPITVAELAGLDTTLAPLPG